MKRNKKTLAIFLSKLAKQKKFSAYLEQYATDPDSAAHILWQAYMQGDIEDRIVADFGCGNGIFGIGALALGAKKVYFIDVDKKAIEITKQNCDDYSVEGEYINGDISDFDLKVDTVLMNPPFGVQNEHADKVFLEKAMEVADKIYSIHKIESKNFVSAVSKDHSFEVEGIIEFDFVLKSTMQFHTKEKYIVKVGCWILKRKI
jgi:putative methylase